MKYTNKLNGHTYWISGNKVKVSNGEIVHTSNMDVETFNAMVFNGDMIEIEVNKDNFRSLVNIEKAASPEYQIRYIAFVVHNGADAFKGNVIRRNQAYISWIGERKAQYCKMRSHMIKKDYCTDFDLILDENDFTDFIIGGEWL